MDWDKLQDQWGRDALSIDKDDLIGLLALRFGVVPEGVKHAISDMQDGDAIERLILVAANVPKWELFVAELRECGMAFRIVGHQYQPF